MRKKNKNLTITCILLTLIILVLLGYIVILKTTYKNEIKNNDKNTIEKQANEKDFDLKKAELLLEEFGFNRRRGCETILRRNYDDNYKAIVVLEKITKDKIYEENCSDIFNQNAYTEDPESMYKGDIGVCFKNNKVETITYNDANAIYKKMFNEDMPTEHVNGLQNNSLDYILYEYINDKDIFAKLDFYGVGGACTSQHIREIKSATQTNNTIKIVVYDYESEYANFEDGIYHFDTDKLSTDIECSDENNCLDIIKNKYINFLDEYEIIFEIENNQYIFKEFNKLTQ